MKINNLCDYHDLTGVIEIRQCYSTIEPYISKSCEIFIQKIGHNYRVFRWVVRKMIERENSFVSSGEDRYPIIGKFISDQWSLKRSKWLTGSSFFLTLVDLHFLSLKISFMDRWSESIIRWTWSMCRWSSPRKILWQRIYSYN